MGFLWDRRKLAFPSFHFLLGFIWFLDFCFSVFLVVGSGANLAYPLDCGAILHIRLVAQ